MTPNELFDAALQLAGTGWRVSPTEFQGEPKQLGKKGAGENGTKIRAIMDRLYSGAMLIPAGVPPNRPPVPDGLAFKRRR